MDPLSAITSMSLGMQQLGKESADLRAWWESRDPDQVPTSADLERLYESQMMIIHLAINDAAAKMSYITWAEETRAGRVRMRLRSAVKRAGRALQRC